MMRCCGTSSPVPRSTTPHPLDQVQGAKVLEKCSQALRWLSGWTGVLPIRIKEDGLAEFKIISCPMLLTLLYTILFTWASGIYFPAYLKKQAGLPNRTAVANYILGNLFVGGQFAGAGGTILLIPFIAKDVAAFWNKFAPVVEFLAVKGHRDVYRAPYRRNRVCLVLFILFMFVYTGICWMAFSTNLPFKVPNSTVLTWLEGFAFFSYLAMCSFHLMHVLIFTFFVFTLKHTFEGLCDYIRDISKDKKPSNMDLLREVILIYESLTSVARDMGNAFGLYLILELVVMMTSLLMDVFTMMSNFQQRDIWSTSLCFFGYILLMITVSESGERLQSSGRLCLTSLKDAVYNNDDQMDLVILHKMTTLQHPKITASNFFTVNRKLATALGSTFATYVVVIIQFKLNVLADEKKN